jgi:hypothetical protein
MDSGHGYTYGYLHDIVSYNTIAVVVSIQHNTILENRYCTHNNN